jgi:hypothetical protein
VNPWLSFCQWRLRRLLAAAERWQRRRDKARASLGLIGRSRAIAAAMLRMAGLDDVSMDLEEARLRRELARLQAERAGRSNAELDAAIRAAARDLLGRHD